MVKWCPSWPIIPIMSLGIGDCDELCVIVRTTIITVVNIIKIHHIFMFETIDGQAFVLNSPSQLLLGPANKCALSFLSK